MTEPKGRTSPQLLKEQVDGCVERIKQCREAIATHGLTVDASEEPGWKPNPFIKIEEAQRRLYSATSGEPGNRRQCPLPRRNGTERP